MLYFILYGWYKRKYIIGEEVIAKPESNVVGNFPTVNAAGKGITKRWLRDNAKIYHPGKIKAEFI